ncbi:hypothetical protein DSL72_002895 [Monilinia vaccinii-corymbosi]|uniref:Uncharacterized protein n=1 Tax=Monilinia vaccinii-corymbosi TaxID=61207 RepID=A0A8A3PDP2_9HELO|nr:hypothetical protein DSL72_002895 [Monilinia vaccinii-corymbosi]
MSSRYLSGVCKCNRRPFSSVLLLFAIIFPKFSYAQVPYTVPTTFITSAFPHPPTPLTLNTRQENPSQNPPNPQPEEDTSSHIYNYYFVIVAVFVVIFFFLLLYITRRRTHRAELLRNNGQSALISDVQSFADFRTRFGPRRGGPALMGMTMGIGVHRETREGLDERGEAPPAYVADDKPPSLRSEDGIAMVASNVEHGNAAAVATAGDNNTTEHDTSGLELRSSAELSRQTTTTASNSARRMSIGGSSTPITIVTSNQDVELRPLSRSASSRPPLGPPTYSEAILGGHLDLARPAAAVTAHGRFALTRD